MQILLANSKQEVEKILSDPFIVNHDYQEFSIPILIEVDEDNNYLIEDMKLS